MNRWPLNKAYTWESAPFLRLLLPLAVGIMVYDNFPEWNLFNALIVVVLSFAVLAFMARRKANKGKVILFVAVNCLLACGGHCIAWLNDSGRQPSFYERHCYKDNTTCLARITAEPADKEHSWKIPVAIIRTIDKDTIPYTKGAGILYIYKDELPMLYHCGDTILLPGKWEQVENAGNPHEFDHARYLRRNNICYQQFCAAKAVRLYAQHNTAEESYTERAHNWCMVQLDRYITDVPTKGLIQAMLLGNEVNLDNDTRQSFSDTGIVHIIAISGGNIMMFFAVIVFLLRWIKNKKYNWIAYVIALPLIWFYVVMAGASPSAIRAAIMFSLLAVGILFSKNNNSLNQLFATAFILLCAQPMWLYSLGFQLSFVAVLSIIVFYAPVYKFIQPKQEVKMYKWLKWIHHKVLETIAASLAAEILVAPLVVYYFHNFPVMFLVANVLAFVFMFIVLLLGMLIIGLSWLPAVATILGTINVWLVGCFNALLKWLQLFNPTAFHFLKLTLPQLVLLYMVIIGVSLLLLRKQKRGLFIALGSMCGLLLLMCTGKWYSLQQERFVVYNIGKTNHMELISGDHYSVLSQDTVVPSKIRYATEPAHIQWRAWHRTEDTRDSLLYVGGNSILILNEPVSGGPFEVNYVVINYHADINIKQLHDVFPDAYLVIGNNYTRKEQLAIVKSAGDASVGLHVVGIDGACYGWTSWPAF